MRVEVAVRHPSPYTSRTPRTTPTLYTLPLTYTLPPRSLDPTLGFTPWTPSVYTLHAVQGISSSGYSFCACRVFVLQKQKKERREEIGLPSIHTNAHARRPFPVVSLPPHSAVTLHSSLPLFAHLVPSSPLASTPDLS